jgi:hypothetical protein
VANSEQVAANKFLDGRYKEKIRFSAERIAWPGN